MTADDDFNFEEDSEQTAVVNLADLRGLRKPQQDRHLLVRVQGSQLGEVQRLGPGVTHVGRSQESELWLPDDGVSRRHARFVPDANGGFILEDLQSANGTFVQGERITRRLLQDGDLVQVGPTAVFRYSIADEDQEALLRQLYAASVTDALTGAHKREHFDAQLANELSYARRHQRDCSVVMFDLDHFKRLNDTYGHPAGDEVLIVVARTVRQVLRSEDMLARYGGEEFAIILRAIDLQGATQLAERLRSQVESLVVEHEGRSLRVTLSAGCASVRELGDPKADELVAVADRRLYVAKRSGRNRVASAG